MLDNEEILKMHRDVVEFVALMDKPEFNPLDTTEHQELMLNILLFRMNKSAYSLNVGKALKYAIFRKWYVKRADINDPKYLDFVLSMVMLVQKRQDYVVPLIWHDVMVAAFNDKKETQ